jgi:RimJ/RimL family protein N-acetyltransferase
MQDAIMRNERDSLEIVLRAESPIWIRTAVVGDVDKLCAYYSTLSRDSRYNRFMGAVSNFSKLAFDCLMQLRRAECFTLVAEWREQGCDVFIGEASYAFDRSKRCGEFAMSVADRWQGQGLGSALLSAVQLRAVSLGYLDLFGETLKTNEQMQSLARKAGFACSRAMDWRAVRFDKRLAA